VVITSTSVKVLLEKHLFTEQFCPNTFLIKLKL